MSTRAILLIGFALVGCHQGGPVTRDGGVAPVAASPRPALDPSTIGITNLDAEIADAERPQHHDDPAFSKRLPGLLLERAGYLGTTEDYDLADQLTASPRDGDDQLARARVLAALHRWPEALTALDAAAGVPAENVARVRATILLATGRCAEASASWPEARYPADITVRGAIEQHVGRPGVAEALFERARTHFDDVSALTFGFLDFERARAYEREGDNARAHVYLEDAIEVFPEYAHAAVHLAPLVPPQRALDVLAVVERRATDPDVFSAHADALRRLKRDDEARDMASRARQRYEAMLVKHPEAFADHAARFFLGAGGDVTRATVLAKSAAERSPTEEALELLYVAASASGDHALACSALTTAAKSSCTMTPTLESASSTCR